MHRPHLPHQKACLLALALFGLAPLAHASRVAAQDAAPSLESGSGGAEAHESVCTGRQDEDGDGLADCADADCFHAPECRTGSAEERSNDACSDWIDNDGDGAVDCDDDECAMDWVTVCRGSWSGGSGGGAGDGDEAGGGDSLPDLGEGMSVEDLIGSGGDTDGERSDEACADGLDNDMDGRADCQDFGCRFDPNVTVCQGSPGIRFSVVSGVGARVTLGFDTNDSYVNNTPDAGFTLLQLRALGSIPFIHNSFFLVNVRAERGVRLTFLNFQVPLGDAGHYVSINSGSGTLTTARIISAARQPLLDPAFYMVDAFEQGNGGSVEVGGPIDSGGVMRFRLFGAAGAGLFTGNVGGARIDTTAAGSTFAWAAGAQLQIDAVGHTDRFELGIPYTPMPLSLSLTAGAKFDQRPTERFVAWQAGGIFRWGHLFFRAETIGRYMPDYGGAAQEAFNLQASALIVPRLITVAADFGGFYNLLAYDRTMIPATLNTDLFQPEEMQWRAAVHWFFFRNVGTLSALYRENYSPQVVDTTALRAPIERELRLEARFRF